MTFAPVIAWAAKVVLVALVLIWTAETLWMFWAWTTYKEPPRE